MEVAVLATENDVVCRTKCNYGETPAFRFTGEMMSGDKPAEYHISSVERCKVGAVKEMKKNQSWRVRGKYDYDVQPGNIEQGHQGAVSSFSLLFRTKAGNWNRD
jgi:hypothetical protein